MPTRQQGLTLFTGIVCLVAVLVIIQLWLVAAAVNALLSHETGIEIPAAVASVALFLVNGGLLLHVLKLDDKIRRNRENG